MLKKKKRPVEDDPYRTNLDRSRDKLKEAGGDNRWWKPKPNSKNIIRILPPWGKSAEGVFYFTAGLHYNFQIGGQNRAVPCNRTKSTPERCIICEFAEALKNSGSEDLEKLVSGNRGIKVKRKYWVNLIDRKYPDEVKMYGSSRKFIQTLQDAIDDPDYGDITDVDEGYDIRVNRTGAGFTDTRYSFTVRPKPSPLGLPEWKTLVHQLDKEVVEWMTLSEMAKVLRANYSDEMKECGFEIKIPNEGKKKKVKDEDEDEEVDTDSVEEDDEEDDEEEADEKPAKGKKVIKKKATKEDDEDEDDDGIDGDDDDDEDEDEED